MQTHSFPWLQDKPQFPLPHSPFGYRPLLPPCSPGAPGRSAPPWSERWFRRTLGAFSAHTVRNTCIHSPATEPGPTRTNPLLGSPGSEDGSVLTVNQNRAAGRTEHQQPRLHPSGEESPSAPPGGTQGGFSVFLPSRDPTDTRSDEPRILYRTPKSCSASNTARHIYGYNMWPLHNVTSRGVSGILYLGGGGAAI